MPMRTEDRLPQGVADLEPGAWQALRDTARSVRVAAGAGAGKTEFLAQKAACLLQTGAADDFQIHIIGGSAAPCPLDWQSCEECGLAELSKRPIQTSILSARFLIAGALLEVASRLEDRLGPGESRCARGARRASAGRHDGCSHASLDTWPEADCHAPHGQPARWDGSRRTWLAQTQIRTSLPRRLTPATLVNHISWNSLAALMPDPLVSCLLEHDRRLQRLHRGSRNLDSSPRARKFSKVPEGALFVRQMRSARSPWSPPGTGTPEFLAGQVCGRSRPFRHHPENACRKPP